MYCKVRVVCMYVCMCMYIFLYLYLYLYLYILYSREMSWIDFWLAFVVVWSPQMFEMVQWLLGFTFEPTRGDEKKPRPTRGFSIIAPSPSWIQRARIQLDQLVYLARFKLCHSSLVTLVLLLLSPDQKWGWLLAVFFDNVAFPPSPSWMLQSGVVVVVVCVSPSYGRIVTDRNAQTDANGTHPPWWTPPSLTLLPQ